MTDQDESEPTVVEWSADGALMIEIDSSGAGVRVQVEPEAAQSWGAEVLADRIMRLHRLALMRARADARLRANESGIALPPSRGWPSLADVDQYRRTIDF
ncbi:MAG: hypothetical protein K2Q25_04355 [Mycobacteriaceae bacterium]|nr:hypothetical protein [Mycobacteriaceae bacterium]